MSEPNKNIKKKLSTFEVLSKIVSDKKEVKQRVKNGENLRVIAKEKGLKIVLPI